LSISAFTLRALWRALRVYARKRISSVPDARIVKLLIQSTFTLANRDQRAGLPAATHLGVTCRSFIRCVAARASGLADQSGNFLLMRQGRLCHALTRQSHGTMQLRLQHLHVWNVRQILRHADIRCAKLQ
jgi:hypothetical protein